MDALSLDEARALLSEYLEVLATEKDELYREHGPEDPGYRATLRLWARVYKLGVDSVFTDEEFAEVVSELRRRAAAGEAPQMIVRAFIVTHKDLRVRRREMEEYVREMLQTRGPEELRRLMRTQTVEGRSYYRQLVRDSVDAVLTRSAAAAPMGALTSARVIRNGGPRARESRPRAARVRSSRASPGRPGSSDDDLADLRRPRRLLRRLLRGLQ
jgi:hypothetical protein